MSNDKEMGVTDHGATGGSLSRRKVFAAATAGAALAAVSATASAQTPPAGPAGGAVAPSTAKPVRRDPRTFGPKPPFRPQNQPFPGLVSKMDPRPDHGETSYVGSGRLLGLRALITGGDSGMGRAAAIAFAREGADVAIAHLPEEEPDAREVVGYIQAAGRKAILLTGDLREEATCQGIVASAVTGLGGLDIVVNTAGVQQLSMRLEELETAQFDRTMKTNLYAPFWITKAALPHLSDGSAIINMVSALGINPTEAVVDYGMTKAGMINFTRSMAKQLARRGIRVNAVAAGPVWTPLIVNAGGGETWYATLGANTPMGRPGQPAELAPLFVQLADPTLSYSTGQVFGATGGLGVA